MDERIQLMRRLVETFEKEKPCLHCAYWREQSCLGLPPCFYILTEKEKEKRD